jgi:ribonuclease P/MRP protein subunit POP3
VNPSKGKKRKRKSKEADVQTSEAPPPPPEIGSHILVGINSVTRHLEALAARHAPKSMPVADVLVEKDKQKKADDQLTEGEEQGTRPLSMIFLTHPKPSASPAHAHFPTLVHLSTLQNPIDTTAPKTRSRLVPLASSADARLATALHIPRVGALAIFANTPGAKALEGFVRDNVDVTECKWIDEAMKAEWRGLNVKSEVSVAKATKKQHVKDVDKASAPEYERSTKTTNKTTEP